MKNILIGMAGHIDHGKTTLIKYLTGKDTDTLPEEKKRGITIDIGFSFLEISKHEKIGIVDVPGHEKFIKNMVAGVSGINYVILVVAADDGVMPQTEEHFNILKLLGIKYGSIVITKCDMVEKNQIEKTKEEIKNLVKDSFLDFKENEEKIFETSIKDINSYEIFKKFLIENIKKCEKENKEKNKEEKQENFRMYIDRSFSIKGLGTVVTGTVQKGSVNINDTLYIYPKNYKIRVKSIENHEIKFESIDEGKRCALNISDIKKDEIRRGDIISSSSSLVGVDILGVMIEELKNIKNNENIKINLGTKEILGKIKIFTKEVNLKENKYPAQIYLKEKIFPFVGELGIIRDSFTGRLLGGFKILDISSSKIKISDKEYPKNLINIYEDNFVGHDLENNKEYPNIKNILETFHKDFHLKNGILKAELKNKYYLSYSQKEFNNFIDENVKSDIIKSENINGKEYISLKNYKIKLTKEEKVLKEKIFKIYKEGGFIPQKRGIIEKEFTKFKNFEDIHSYMVKQGMIVFLQDDFYILKGFLLEISKIVTNYLIKNKILFLSEIKDILNIKRNFAIMILEKLDSLKITKREKDYRILYDKGEKNYD